MADSHKEDGRPSFQFYPKDWLSDTELRMCSMATQGVWINLLCLMWNAPVRGVLMYSPDGVCYNKMDNKRISKILGCYDSDIDTAVQELLDNGVLSQDTDGFLYSRRLKRETRVSEIRSEAGKKGMENRWKQKENITNCDSVITKTITKHNPPSSSSSSSSTATPKIKKGPSPIGGDIPPDFESFWKAYPRKEARAVALKAWEKAKPDLPAVMAALEWQRAFWTDPKFIPMPATYLNQRRWEDERKIDATPIDPTGTSALQRYQEQFKRGEF